MRSVLLLLSLLGSLAAQSAAPPRSWTVLVYGGSDNDSEESFCPDIQKLRTALPDSGTDEAARVAVLCLVDRSAKYSDSRTGFGSDFSGARLYELTREGARQIDPGDAMPQLAATTVDSGDPALVRDFLRYAKRHYPAEHTALVFYSHGNGAQWCPDESHGTHLTAAGLSAALAERDRVDLMVFDVCEMAALADAYQWRPREGAFAADVVVATPMAGFPLPWRRIMRHVAGAADAQVFARAIIEETKAHRASSQEESLPEHVRRVIDREAMAALDLGRVEAAARAVHGLARALAVDPGARERLLALRRDGPVMTYARDYVDIYDLARRIVAGGFGEPVARAADEVSAAVDALVVESYGMTGYAAAGGFRAGQSGVHLVFPEVGAEPATLWRRLRWYLPEADPAAGLGFALLAAGAQPGDGVVDNWFELLDAWLDDDADHNGYRY
ncbi:MAG: clostripain-related cysteine peptidase [Planctomycetota bacterium]